MAVPCAPWADESDLCAPCDTYEGELVDLPGWLDVATLVMFNLTGQRFGVCDDELRPCRPRRGCSDGCSCPGLPSFRLPGVPVVAVDLVMLDGVEVPASVDGGLGWRVDDDRDLVLVVPTGSDGHGPRHRRTWPCCQDMRLPDTAEGTWSVGYSFGVEPPDGAARMTAHLACQLALSCDPEAVEDGRCQLPEQTTQVSRQGITIALSSVESLFSKGTTGLKSIDAWLMSLRWGAGARTGRGWRPGAGRSARRVGTTATP